MYAPVVDLGARRWLRRATAVLNLANKLAQLGRGVLHPRMRCAKSVVLLLTFVAGVARAEPTASAAPEPTDNTADEPNAPAPTSVPPPSAPPTAPTPATAPALAPAPPSALVSLPRMAQIRFAVSHPDAWLEARPFGGTDPWQPRCKAPCGQWIDVEGAELRVTAPGMTPTSPFRVQPGSGTALLTVNGGSSTARTLGRLGLGIGLPLALVGMAGFGYGHFDERRGLETAGAITLAAGAALVLAALPLLVSGSTSVRNAEGDLIAAATSSPAF